MRHLFGRKGTDDVIASTYDTMEEKGTNYAKQIQELDEKILQIGKQLKDPANSGRQQYLKRNAMNLMKKKKHLEFMYNSLQSHQFALTQIAYQNEMNDAALRARGMNQPKEQPIKSQLKKVTVEDWDNLVIDSPEVLSVVNSISDVLSGLSKPIETAELDDEYAALDNQLSMQPPSLNGLVSTC